MSHNDAFIRKSKSPFTDPAKTDKVCLPAAARVGDWYGKRAPHDPVVARVKTYAFDPYNQARPDLYAFQRDAKEALVFYAQTRLDGKFLGTVETTARGHSRESVLRIQWKKNGGADLTFDMIGDREDVEPIASGYCKMTDLGGLAAEALGTHGWVACVTKLHGRNIKKSQVVNLLSLPLFEAIATGCAFGRFKEDAKLREMHPTLATQAPAAVGMYGASTHGTGVEQWMRAEPADQNWAEEAANDFNTIDVPGFLFGKVLEVVPKRRERAIGAVYPIRIANDAINDALVVDRVIVGEKRVVFKDYPSVTHATKYEVLCFSNGFEDGEVAIATLHVVPVAKIDESSNKLKIDTFAFVPSVGSMWGGAGAARSRVTDEHVELARSKVAPWNAAFMSTVEAAIFKIKSGGADIAT